MIRVAQTPWFATPRVREPQALNKTHRAKSAFVSYLIFLIFLAFTCSLFYIWSRIQVLNVGYEINRGISLQEKLTEENKRLTLEMAVLKSPVRLEGLAKNEYHMDLPRKTQLLSDIVGVEKTIPVMGEVSRR